MINPAPPFSPSTSLPTPLAISQEAGEISIREPTGNRSNLESVVEIGFDPGTAAAEETGVEEEGEGGGRVESNAREAEIGVETGAAATVDNFVCNVEAGVGLGARTSRKGGLTTFGILPRHRRDLKSVYGERKKKARERALTLFLSDPQYQPKPLSSRASYSVDAKCSLDMNSHKFKRTLDVPQRYESVARQRIRERLRL